ncbi:hypothetical protein [Flavobacterium oreochromis]|nr:hypothetical protein [Flavobacterium oreochromis]
MREIAGMVVNQPLDKFNHFWDAARYAHIAYNQPSTIYDSSEEDIENINY